MKRGNTERETLELNGWGIGDILEGDKGHGPQRILITAIGETEFLCKWDYECSGKYERGEDGSTTLSLRDWKKIDSIANKNDTVTMPKELTSENGAKAIFIGEFHINQDIECNECEGLGHEDTEEMLECVACEGAGLFRNKTPVEWAMIKDIYALAVKRLAK